MQQLELPYEMLCGELLNLTTGTLHITIREFLKWWAALREYREQLDMWDEDLEPYLTHDRIMYPSGGVAHYAALFKPWPKRHAMVMAVVKRDDEQFFKSQFRFVERVEPGWWDERVREDAAARSMWFPRLSSNTCESDIREVDCTHLVREFDLSSSSDIR